MRGMNMDFLKETTKSIAFIFGKAYEFTVFTFKTLSWATIKSWNLGTKSVEYLNQLTGAARVLKNEADLGRQTQRSKNHQNPL